MKNLLLLSAAAALYAFLPATAFSQSPKFGHINSAELLEQMPEIKEADQQLQEYAKQLEGQYQSMVAEYQSKIQQYQDQQGQMLDAVKEVKQKEITDLEGRIQGFQQGVQDKLLKKKEELYSPHLKKAEDAIKAVAKEKGYAYVFDTSTGAFIYTQESDDLMSLVKQKLGLK